MSRERLGARSDFDEWANTVVAAVKKRRSRAVRSADREPERDRSSFREWASRVLTKIAA